ncbi:MAG: radical SAM protein [Desulfobaccales bacterium]
MTPEPYGGYEQGPFRPPSEAGSLLLRVTRNCPWNRCKFCPLYKGTEFSVRPTDHVLRDIDALYRAMQTITGEAEARRSEVMSEAPGDAIARQAAAHWRRHGRHSVFLQDADSLVIPPAAMVAILNHLAKRFPGVPRVTSYARSSTVARLDLRELQAIREAGLNRLHIGLESGANEVLRRMHKGATQKNQITAGQKVKQAGMELSEYYMPGLGGRDLWETNAKETAAALNEINPDFIRLRTLAIPCGAPLYEDYQAGRFDLPNDVEMAREILLFLESLHGITSTVASDHILNLLPEVEGTLPQDQGRMLAALETFLKLSPAEQCLYQVGRRTGVFSGLDDLENPFRRRRAEEIIRKNDITPANVDGIIDELMRRFV